MPHHSALGTIDHFVGCSRVIWVDFEPLLLQITSELLVEQESTLEHSIDGILDHQIKDLRWNDSMSPHVGSQWSGFSNDAIAALLLVASTTLVGIG